MSYNLLPDVYLKQIYNLIDNEKIKYKMNC